MAAIIGASFAGPKATLVRQRTDRLRATSEAVLMRTVLRISTRELARLFRLARGALALFGLAAVLAVAFPLPQPAVATLAGSAMVEPLSARGPIVPVAATPDESAREREERVVADYIARRYRVAEAASTTYVSSAYRSGLEFSVDPLLILAVMAVESRYNPVAESAVGARGLMQIIPRWHPEKLLEHGGEYALLDPEVNIQVGARILREYMARAGEMEAALQMYNGALDEPTARYAGKVLAEKARLRQFLVAALGDG
jgi:soluble lytic murein transglycosylase-like protein